MRSYSYKAGVWAVIVDPLPKEANVERDVKSDSEIDLPTDWSAYTAHEKAFNAALAKWGFTRKRLDRRCPLGDVEIYARDHVDLGVKRVEKDLGYDFFAVLRFCDTSIRVWLPDLPNLLLFLREIEAHEERRENTSVADAIKEVFYDGDVQNLLLLARNLARSIEQGKAVITVKSPMPEQKK